MKESIEGEDDLRSDTLLAAPRIYASPVFPDPFCYFFFFGAVFRWNIHGWNFSIVRPAKMHLSGELIELIEQWAFPWNVQLSPRRKWDDVVTKFRRVMTKFRRRLKWNLLYVNLPCFSAFGSRESNVFRWIFRVQPYFENRAEEKIRCFYKLRGVFQFFPLFATVSRSNVIRFEAREIIDSFGEQFPPTNQRRSRMKNNSPAQEKESHGSKDVLASDIHV